LYLLVFYYCMAGHYQGAISEFKNLQDRCLKGEFPLSKAHWGLALSYMMSGQEEKARAHAAELLKLSPRLSLDYVRKTLRYKNQADSDRIIDAMRKAGIPEHPPLPLPDKPSIAVLPFTNMSGDPKQDYIGEGISESIITALTKIPKLFVIARNSSFTYKGKSVKVQQIGRDLGVRYVLEGSMQKSGDRLRITAQLIDSTTGNHLWADRYDRNIHMKDIFPLQDEVTMKILTALQVKLTEGEQARVYAKGTDNLKAYLKLLEGLSYFGKMNKEDNIKARQMFEEAIALDPKYAFAYVKLAGNYVIDYWLGGKSTYEPLKKARELAEKALALDDSLAGIHRLRGYLWAFEGSKWVDAPERFKCNKKAIAELEKAVALAPNSAETHIMHGMVLTMVGRPEEAIPVCKKGIRLNPIPPGYYYLYLGMAYLDSGRYEESIEPFKKAIDRSPNNIFSHAALVFVYNKLAREEDARKAAAEILRINPEFSIWQDAKAWPGQWLIALRNAGLE